MKKYSIGLDIGTNSVGWAVVDENCQLVKKNGYTLWGVRLFDEANDASERRIHRGERRRLERRRYRIKLLREIFYNEIVKVDPTFFERLDDSYFIQEDKRNNNFYNIFTDEYTDKEFFKDFPTIFHLRKYLMDSKNKEDIRFIYLAIHNMIKYRGNFLYQGDKFNSSNDSRIREIMLNLNVLLSEFANEFDEFSDYFEQFKCDDDFYIKLKEALLSKCTKNELKTKLRYIFAVDKKSLINECIIPLLIGSKCNFSSLYPVKHLKYETCEIILSDENLTSIIEESKSKVTEFTILFDFLNELKEMVDFYYLSKLLKNDSGKSDYSLSDAMIRKYNDHAQDLKDIKYLLRKYLPNKYYECFKLIKDDLNNYPKYIGMNNVKSKLERFKHCSRDDFYKYILSLLRSIEVSNDDFDLYSNIISRIESGDFLPRQNSNQNGSIPMQLNLAEIETILNNQRLHYEFIDAKDEDGISNYEKIISIFKFKIPYYVGPLNKKSSRSWIVRNDDKIYPWNLEKVVDVDETATNFIERMQNKCTYLKGDNDYCLPKHSILYSKYNCLSYLNKININGILISPKLKMEIFNNVFLKIKKPNKKDIVEYIKSNYGTENIKTSLYKELPEITCSMASYIKFNEIFGGKIEENIELAERIIKDIVIFEDKKILVKRLRNLYKLKEEQIKSIKDLNYKGYGRLCKRLLNGLSINDNESGEIYDTLIDIMEKTNYNLEEILYNPNYRLIDIIEKYNLDNSTDSDDETIDEFLEKNALVSPNMKRGLIQAYNIIKEVRKILNQQIDKYYIECTRTNKNKKGNPISRYDRIKDLYNNSKEIAISLGIDFKRLNKELENYKDSLKSDLIYLYFSQLGKCMYSLNDIDLETLLSSNNIYDIDHIYPQALVKDDSMNNRVLVLKDYNNRKQDNFIFEIDNFLNKNAYDFYEKLYNMNLISREKYSRLNKKELTKDELETFVNRQIVSTNQAVKGLVQVLKLFDRVESTNIIYSKAENISDARKLFDWPKSRLANNYHHAHDAYLNVVIGGVIDKYFKGNYFNSYLDYYRFKSEKLTTNIEKVLLSDRYVHGKLIWNKENMIKLINHNLYDRFDVKVTTKTYVSNDLYAKVTIAPKGQGTVPIKVNGSRNKIDVYGGITSYSYGKYVIVESNNKKNKKEYILEAIPNVYGNNVEEYLQNLGYEDFRIINDNIKSNCVVEYENRKFYITSKTSDRFNIVNAKERFFNKYFIKIIKKIEKYQRNIQLKINMIESSEGIIVAPAKSKNVPIIITEHEMIELYKELIKKMNMLDYNYSSLNKIKELNVSSFEKLNFIEKITINCELLKLLQTNAMMPVNLTLLGLSKYSGSLNISKKLNANMIFISESVTGYYKKVIFEVPN